MSGNAVAILPSNQSRNVSPIIPAYNEGGGMHYLAPLVVERCKAKGVNAAWFSARMEHEPGQTYVHQWIAEQIARANAWLKSQGGGVMVHLHTDSGTYSHTFGIYTTRFAESRQLATTLSARVFTALATEQRRVFDRLGDMDYNTYLFAARAEHTPVLIELCTHTVERDIRVLFAQPQVAAEAIAEGLADYLGIVPAVDWQVECQRLKSENEQLRQRCSDQQTILARARTVAQELAGVLG
jgi:hypothetical protein